MRGEGGGEKGGEEKKRVGDRTRERRVGAGEGRKKD